MSIIYLSRFFKISTEEVFDRNWVCFKICWKNLINTISPLEVDIYLLVFEKSKHIIFTLIVKRYDNKFYNNWQRCSTSSHFLRHFGRVSTLRGLWAFNVDLGISWTLLNSLSKISTWKLFKCVNMRFKYHRNIV